MATNGEIPAFIGVDPGASGGIAVVWRSGQAEAWAMPDSGHGVLSLIEDILDTYDLHMGVVEQVGPMPGQGVTSMFNFGRAYERVRMGLSAHKIPFESVVPRKWQAALGIVKRGSDETKTQFKNRLKQRAQELYPNLKVTLKTADALLIATYCMRTHDTPRL